MSSCCICHLNNGTEKLSSCFYVTDAALANEDYINTQYRYLMQLITVIIIIINFHSDTNTNTCNVILTNNQAEKFHILDSVLATLTSKIQVYRNAVVQTCSKHTSGSFRHIFASNGSQMANLQKITTQHSTPECTGFYMQAY